MTMNPKMKDHHKDQLLQALMYYLPMEIRKKIMLEVPAAYNDYHGGEPNIQVCHVDDGTPVSEDPNQRITIVTFER